jgi:uncharacterized protein (TIGR02646 family)
MKRLQRLPLSAQALAFLRERSDAVSKADNPRALAGRFWELQDNKAFREIREVLLQMASGVERCMYCEDSAASAIDHFWPRSDYPERAFDWLNYLLACSICNSNFKRDRFPLDEHGQPLLFDPTAEDPLGHLELTPTTGTLATKTPKGSWSILVYGLNRTALEIGRANTWILLEELLVRYSHALRTGKAQRAARIEHTVRNHPFAGVLTSLIRIATGPEPAGLLDADCLAAIQQHPAILSWA